MSAKSKSSKRASSTKSISAKTPETSLESPETSPDTTEVSSESPEASPDTTVETPKNLKTPPAKLKLASHGKRLFALIIDFVIAVLLVNTFNHLAYAEHWDLNSTTSRFWEDVALFYFMVFSILLVKDLFRAASPGKFVVGITIRRVDDFNTAPPYGVLLLRNVMLILLPLEGVIVFIDRYIRRLGDQWLGTVVIEHPNPMRFIHRLMGVNILFFGSFFVAWFIQEIPMKRTAAYQTALDYLQTDPEVARHLGTIQELESPEMSLDVRDGQGTGFVRVQVVGSEDSEPVTVYLQLITSPQKSWKPERLTIGEEPESKD